MPYFSLAGMGQAQRLGREPNARRELRLEAGARYERTLEAVSSTPLFGVGFSRDALFLTPPPAQQPPAWLLCACVGT
jgi:hypothetical protein